MKRKHKHQPFFLLLFVSIFMASFNPVCASSSEIKKVYLTFDDGPIPVITEKILDVLKEENVKATFFVVGKEIPEREYILKRISKEGHGIGLHTYSHKMNKIYKNENRFVEEMLQTREKIKEVTYTSPAAVRFPGGSSKRLTTELLDELHRCNMKVFDWNLDLYDGSNSKVPVYKIIENSKCIKEESSRVIILAHCNSNNINTVKALPEIIRFYKSKNYAFSVIDDKTPEYYYRIKKRKTVFRFFY